MAKTNCPNCGAVYEPLKNKCPYCGTSYYDMSALDFSDGEPFYLKIRTKIKGKKIFLTQLVKPSLGGITTECSTKTCYGGLSNTPLFSFYASQLINTVVSFQAVPQEDGSLLTMEVIE